MPAPASNGSMAAVASHSEPMSAESHDEESQREVQRLAFQGTVGGARALGELSGEWRVVLPMDVQLDKHSLRRVAPRLAVALCAVAGVLMLVATAFTRSSGRATPKELELPDWWNEEPRCSFGGGSGCPARQLLESREVCTAVARNVLILSRAANQTVGDQAALDTAVAVFGTLGTQLSLHAPDITARLQDVLVTDEELQAILEMLLLIGELEVQGIGKIVAKAITEENSTQRTTMTQRIREHLGPEWDNIRVVRNKAIPAPLRALWGDGHPDLVMWENGSHKLWEMSLEESNVFSVKSAREMASVEADLAESRGLDFTIWAAAMVQGRAILDLLQMYVRVKGNTVDTELGRTFDFAFAALSWPCQLDLPTSGDSSRTHDTMQEMMCPLKFGAMGMDALRATFVDDASTALRATFGAGLAQLSPSPSSWSPSPGGPQQVDLAAQ